MPDERKKILVVDDDTLLQELLVLTLETQGYLVTAASNGKHGVDLARTERFDLILLDMMMPVLDGYRMLKFKPVFKWQDVPILVLTAIHDDVQVNKIKKAGAVGVLCKPIDTHVLLQTVARYL